MKTVAIIGNAIPQMEIDKVSKELMNDSSHINIFEDKIEESKTFVITNNRTDISNDIIVKSDGSFYMSMRQKRRLEEKKPKTKIKPIKPCK